MIYSAIPQQYLWGRSGRLKAGEDLMLNRHSPAKYNKSSEKARKSYRLIELETFIQNILT